MNASFWITIAITALLLVMFGCATKPCACPEQKIIIKTVPCQRPTGLFERKKK